MATGNLAFALCRVYQCSTVERYTGAQEEFMTLTEEPPKIRKNVEIHLTVLGDEMDAILIIFERASAEGAHSRSAIKTSPVKTSPMADCSFSSVTIEWQTAPRAPRTPSCVSVPSTAAETDNSELFRRLSKIS
jgi:hypothetical protein